MKLLLSGAAHVHGVLFINIDKLIENETKNGNTSFKYLKSALKAASDNSVPNEEEKKALVAFSDRFVSCSLTNPDTKKIAEEVQLHRHTKCCRKRGSNCRFNYPRLPALKTILSIPMKLLFDEENEDDKRETSNLVKSVLDKVKDVLEDGDLMEELCQIRCDEIDDLLQQRTIILNARKFVEDPVLKKKIQDYDIDCKSTIKNESLGHSLVQNLESFIDYHKGIADKMEFDEEKWFEERLLAVLQKADINDLLSIDDKLSVDERNKILLEKYHHFLQFSNKGFSVVLKRDIQEIFINNYCPEWLPAWNANMDISMVFDFFAVLTYVR